MIRNTHRDLRFLLGSALSLVLLALAAYGGCEWRVSQEQASVAATADTAATHPLYTQGPSQYPDGTGRFYMGREIAPVMGHRGAAWLERPEREQTELPNRVVRGLELEPSDVVADIGAGTGYFTFRLSPEVPRGLVYAVDIQPEMLSRIRERMAQQGQENVVPLRGTPTDPQLPAGTVDVALMVDAYHEFSYPREMMERIVEALKPGGRVALVEYRSEDPTLSIKPLHTMSEAQARREMEAVGLQWRETKSTLPQQHLMIFEKPVG